MQPCALKDHESNLSPSLKCAEKGVYVSRHVLCPHIQSIVHVSTSVPSSVPRRKYYPCGHDHRTIPAVAESQGEPTWTGATCAQHAKDTQRVQCGSTPMPRPALSHAHVTTKKMQTNPTSEGVYHNDRTAAACAVVPSAHAARSLNESGQHTQPITSTNHPGYHRAHACTSAANQLGCGGRTRP